MSLLITLSLLPLSLQLQPLPLQAPLQPLPDARQKDAAEEGTLPATLTVVVIYH